jgi:PAS domain S-box-containing protein
MMLTTPLRRVTSGLLSPILSILLTLGLSAPAFAQSQPQVDMSQKNVVVLHALESNVPIFELTDRGIRATLDAGRVAIRSQFFEYLDLARNPGPEYRKHLVELMQLRYGKRKVDIIVTLYPEALQFALDEGGTIFPDVPIVALYLPPGFEPKKTGRQIIRQPVEVDLIGTLESALQIVPGTKQVYVVSGAHALDRKYEDEARRSFRKWDGQLEFRYLSDIPLQRILDTVSTAPANTIVLLMGFATDVTGKNYTTREVSQRLSEVSKVPVFGLHQVALGYGITGGKLISFEHIGTKAGELVLDILRGTQTPENIPNILDVPPVPMFDWRQLRRWNLSESALPKGSIVINKEPTLWDFKYYIIGGIAAFLAQTMLVIGLLIQRRRKIVAEASLRQKTEELDQFFNVTLDLLGIANTDGYFLRLNPAVERVLGYTREEVMAQPFFEFIHPDDVDRTREAVSILASQQKVFFFENRYRCKDGTYRWLQWSSAPAGNLIYAAARDVTEHKELQEKIRKAAEEWQATFDSVRDLVMILDKEFKIVRVNAATISFFNLPLEGIVGNHCYTLMHGTNEPVEICPLSQVMKTKTHEETELYDDKAKAWFHVSVDPILDDKGEITRAVHTVKDITERKRAEQEAFDARRELTRMERLSRMGELSASLSHELNQPLTAILSNARAALRFLQSGKLDLAELEEILQDIVKDDKRAGDIIRNLRAMVKPEEGEQELTSINDVLHETVALFRSEAIIRNVRIETDLADALPPLHVNKVQIQQVLINLMTNAAESMTGEESAERIIVLRTAASGEGVVKVAVRDFGSGIEEQELHKIFEPFFTTKRSGLGMGLSLSRSIIESHGGHIWAENNPDRGMTFYFDLPVSNDK